MQRDRPHVVQKKETVERHLQPALETLLAEHAAVQATAARAGLRAPSVRPAAFPYRGQMPSGYGQ
ncbi:MAG TPA: hypothetical protein VI542_02580 [Candidatus Tectomicrobia bacterium]